VIVANNMQKESKIATQVLNELKLFVKVVPQGRGACGQRHAGSYRGQVRQ
jgi:hypothetical protein